MMLNDVKWIEMLSITGCSPDQLFAQLFQALLKGIWVLASLAMNKSSRLSWKFWIPKMQGQKIQKSEIHGNHRIHGIQIIHVIFQHPLTLGLHCVGTPPRNGCLGCIWASSTLPQVPKQCIWSTLLNSQVESCLLSAIAKVYSSFSFK